MLNCTVALFGEAERGVFQRPYECDSLPQLVDYLGHPPAHSCGLSMAIQTLMYQRHLLFFRVEEEGYSLNDYYRGVHHLAHSEFARPLVAIGVPGVGDPELLVAIHEICQQTRSVILATERDLYDYLTSTRLAA